MKLVEQCFTRRKNHSIGKLASVLVQYIKPRQAFSIFRLNYLLTSKNALKSAKFKTKMQNFSLPNKFKILKLKNLKFK